MPIHSPVKIKALSAQEFEELDYRVMGHAYASQNELGRLCDECAYQADLKARLLADGFRSILTEVPITVTHRDFSKQYFLADDALYELKTDATLVGEHETQLFNYIFLLGIQRAKLLNFRPWKVQGRIISTSLTHEQRRQFTINSNRWINLTPNCDALHQTMLELLQDWGAFLDLNLYQEALIHFLGGAINVERQVELRREVVSLGRQRMLIHAPETAFRITAYTQNVSHIESQLRRLLTITDLKAVQWINLNHTRIEFTTIKK
jgi:hypothetical protein